MYELKGRGGLFFGLRQTSPAEIPRTQAFRKGRPADAAGRPRPGEAQQERSAASGRHPLELGLVRDLSAIRVGDDEARLELRQNGGCPLQNSEAGSREAAQSRHLRSAKVLRAASQPSRQRRYWQAPPARRRSRSDRAAARIRSPTSCTILWNSASRTISAPCGSALMRLVSSGIKSAGSKKSKEPKKVAQSGLSLSGSAFLERALRLRGIAALRGRRLGLGDLRLGAIAIGCDESHP